MNITFKLNGKKTTVDVDPLRRLLDVLRDLGYMGTKEGCGEGECGACTVLLDGRPVTSCLVNIVAADGRHVTTVEGVTQTDAGKLLVDCLHEAEAVQCGFCFPGFVVTCYDYLIRDGAPDAERIRAAVAGNICRCTGYELIVQGVLEACRRWRDR